MSEQSVNEPTSTDQSASNEVLEVLNKTTRVLSILKSWISESFDLGFPKTLENVKKEKDRICSVVKLDKDLITQCDMLKYFKKHNIRKVSIPSQQKLLHVLEKNHDHLANYFNSYRQIPLNSLVTDPKRIFFVTMREYDMNMKEDDPPVYCKILHTFTAEGQTLDEFVICKKEDLIKKPKKNIAILKANSCDLNTVKFQFYLKEVFGRVLDRTRVKRPVVLFTDLNEYVNSSILKLCRELNIVLMSGFPHELYSKQIIGQLLCGPLLINYQEAKLNDKDKNYEADDFFPQLFADVLKASASSPRIIANIKELFKSLGWYPWTKYGIFCKNIKHFKTRETPVYFLPYSDQNVKSIYWLFGAVIPLQNNVADKKPDYADYAPAKRMKRNFVSNLQTEDKRFCGITSQEAYKCIVDHTLAGVFVNMSKNQNFYKQHMDIKFTRKHKSEMGNCDTTLDDLKRWHKSATDFASHKGIADIFKDPTRIWLYDTTVFTIEDETVFVDSNITEKNEKGLYMTHIMSASGTYIKPSIGVTHTSLLKSLNHHSFDTQFYYQSDLFWSAQLDKISKTLKSQNVEFPVVLFVNPYKHKFKPSTIRMYQIHKFIIVGLYPHPFRNFNPAEMILQDSKEEIHNANPPSSILKDILLKFSRKFDTPIIKQKFKAAGIYPWTSKNLKLEDFAKCGNYHFDNDNVIYQSFPENNGKFYKIPCSLNISSDLTVEKLLEISEFFNENEAPQVDNSPHNAEEEIAELQANDESNESSTNETECDATVGFVTIEDYTTDEQGPQTCSRYIQSPELVSTLFQPNQNDTFESVIEFHPDKIKQEVMDIEYLEESQTYYPGVVQIKEEELHIKDEIE